jgi:hypothetical protein
VLGVRVKVLGISLQSPHADMKVSHLRLQLLEDPAIPLPFRIQTVSLRVLDLESKVLDWIV